MDFMKIIESLDEALYTVMGWLVFYPLTLWRALVRPLAMMAYADREVSDAPDEQYDDAIRPPLFLFLTLLISHGLEALVAGRNPLAPGGWRRWSIRILRCWRCDWCCSACSR